MLLSTLLAVCSLFLVSSVGATTCPAVTCHALHLFLARGNNEPYPGRQSAIVASTCSGLPPGTCGYEDLVYSALYTDLSCQTTYDAVIAGRVQMAAYAEACPDSKLVLAGYSQGAQIVLDILGGGGGLSFNGCLQLDTPPMDRSTKPGSMLAAALVFGNTRHTASQPYNYGNGSAIDGLYPRPANQIAAILPYASILRDWCVDIDPICAAHQKVFYVSAHLGYYNNYGVEGGAWIKSVAGFPQTTASGVATTVPGSLSGIVQDYATIGLYTPMGTVTPDTTWTSYTSVVPCTSGTVSTSAASVTLSTSAAGTPVSTSAVGATVSTGSTSASVSTSAVGASVTSSSSGTTSSKVDLSTSGGTALLSGTPVPTLSSGITSSSVKVASQSSIIASSTVSAMADTFEASILKITVVVVALICI